MAVCRTTPSTVHSGPLQVVPDSFFSVPMLSSTPINVDLFESWLLRHPDKGFVEFVISGLRFGFRIGYNRQAVPAGRTKNLLSARENKEAVACAILKELNRGHTIGPFVHPPVSPFHSSPLGAVPKKDGSVRLILDLSCPRGESINEGISEEDYSVRYAKFDDAVDLLRDKGYGAYMGKLDVKHAFRICPVHPADWGFVGFSF